MSSSALTKNLLGIGGGGGGVTRDRQNDRSARILNELLVLKQGMISMSAQECTKASSTTRFDIRPSGNQDLHFSIKS